MEADDADHAEVGRAVTVRETRAGARAPPKVVAGAEFPAELALPLDRRVARGEERVADDVRRLDARLAEDRAAEAEALEALAVLQWKERADGPAQLVADAEAVVLRRIVDRVVGP